MKGNVCYVDIGKFFRVLMANNIEVAMLRTAKGLDLLSIAWAVAVTLSMFGDAMATGFVRTFFLQWLVFAAAIPVGIRSLSWVIRGLIPDGSI